MVKLKDIGYLISEFAENKEETLANLAFIINKKVVCHTDNINGWRRTLEFYGDCYVAKMIITPWSVDIEMDGLYDCIVYLTKEANKSEDFEISGKEIDRQIDTSAEDQVEIL